MAPENGNGKERDINTFGISDLSLTQTPGGSLYNMTGRKRKKDGKDLGGGTLGIHNKMAPQGEDDIFTASPKKRRKGESSSTADEYRFARAQAESSDNPGFNEGKEKQRDVDDCTFDEGKQKEIIHKKNIGERIGPLKNKHINSIDFHDTIYLEWMREIQGVYSFTEVNGGPHTPLEEYFNADIRLVWDHDRIWGYFRFRVFVGYLLVDPGPGEELFQAIGEQNASLPRLQHPLPAGLAGKHKDMPNTIFNSSWTIGAIRFGHWEIEGYFAAMDGAGLPDNKLNFRATRTSEGLCSLASAIDGWNKYRIYNKKEWPRSGIDVEYEADREIGRLMSKIEDLEFLEVDLKDKCGEWFQTEKQEWWKQLLSFVQGVFTISVLSNTTENSNDQEQVMRFNIADRGETIWGQFSIAGSKGHLRCDFPTLRDFSKTERRFEFKYRAKENPEAKIVEGICEITFNLDSTIVGFLTPR